ncbi:MAG: NAD-dependent epimerase/dehydratase family protein [bacterium]
METKKTKKIRKIVITGINSFIGSNLLKRLSNNPAYQIIAIDIKKPASQGKNIKFYNIDLTEPMVDGVLAKLFKKEKVEEVVHLAFLSGPIKNTSISHELEVIGTLNIIHASTAAKIRKLVIRSTTMAYGANATNPNFLTEEHPLASNTNMSYLRDKVEIEHIVKRFKEKNPQAIVTVLRLCAIMGPTINNFLTAYLSTPVILKILGFDPLFQFIHEEDAVNAFRIAVESDYHGIFNIVGKGVLPYSTIIKLLGKLSISIPFPVAYSTISLLWSLNLSPVPPAFLNFIRYTWLADGEKAKTIMKFEPRYSIKETIEGFIGTQRLRELNLA